MAAVGTRADVWHVLSYASYVSHSRSLPPSTTSQPLAVVSSQHFEDPAGFGSVSHSV